MHFYFQEVANKVFFFFLKSYDQLPKEFSHCTHAQWWPTLSGLRNAEGEEAKVAAIEQFMEALMPLEDALAKCGKGKDFFGGDTIWYVDIALGSFLGRLRAIEKMADVDLLDETKTPGLFGWAERFVSNADAKDVIPEADKIVKFIAAELKPNKFPIHAGS
ncbi:hypothetical protein RHSIM_RhsimUnG0210500 [Rhododendron simsii]|uniref:Glutathione S-transferase n=1 Tax=Rhododendron simsii TaxID=118357 RepID=A0A834FTM5_RHOSS|nr:hypothetical protein RHSIM_RhsimUnG0210500 [Rhododendron simsii]